MAQTATAARKPAVSADDHKHLLIHHMTKLRTKRAEVEECRQPLKDAQEEFTALVNEAKADLGKGYTRKYLMTLLEDATTRLRDLLAEEERRARDREALGLPVFGIQADLFGAATAAMPAEAKDEIHYEAEGYIRGRNGAMEILPDRTPPRFHQAVQRGYERGQKATHEDYLAGEELKTKRSQPDAEAETVDLNAQAEDQDAAIDEQAAKLKRSGFTRRSEPAPEVEAPAQATADSDGFEASAEELAAQQPRAAVQEAKAAEQPEAVH